MGTLLLSSGYHFGYSCLPSLAEFHKKWLLQHSIILVCLIHKENRFHWMDGWLTVQNNDSGKTRRGGNSCCDKDIPRGLFPCIHPHASHACLHAVRSGVLPSYDVPLYQQFYFALCALFGANKSAILGDEHGYQGQ